LGLIGLPDLKYVVLMERQVYLCPKAQIAIGLFLLE
jgi:hypothetical protein